MNLWEPMLGIWESIFDLLMLILGLIRYFGLLGLDCSALRVDPEPLGVNIWSLRVNLELQGVVLTRFIGKSNAFLQFYRKNQCVSLFETKAKVFSHTSNHVLPTSCRVEVWTCSSSLLPKKNKFSGNIFENFTKIFLRES